MHEKHKKFQNLPFIPRLGPVKDGLRAEGLRGQVVIPLASDRTQGTWQETALQLG